jgi:hypothetical protein
MVLTVKSTRGEHNFRVHPYIDTFEELAARARKHFKFDIRDQAELAEERQPGIVLLGRIEGVVEDRDRLVLTLIGRAV